MRLTAILTATLLGVGLTAAPADARPDPGPGWRQVHAIARAEARAATDVLRYRVRTLEARDRAAARYLTRLDTATVLTANRTTDHDQALGSAQAERDELYRLLTALRDDTIDRETFYRYTDRTEESIDALYRRLGDDGATLGEVDHRLTDLVIDYATTVEDLRRRDAEATAAITDLRDALARATTERDALAVELERLTDRVTALEEQTR